MQVYGLLGNPVGHSLSPPMHEAAYETLGMDARYVTFEPERDAVEAAVRGADALGIDGLNVTVPFKREVLDQGLVDADPLAARVGAVNTVDFGDRDEEGRPRGYNTDVAGVTRAFEHHGVGLGGREAVVVGAGGAGRAAAFALADAGASVHVANRTASTAEALAEDVAATEGVTSDAVTAGGLDSLAATVPGADLLVNATTVGMAESDESGGDDGESGDETPVPAELLHGELAVLDAVYSPLRTRLLRDAERAGATTIDGLWMLLYQGVEAFERWTGRDAPVAEMDAAVRSAL
ncbi:shikimate dehydrogenase [Halobium salinum]|uniref:Shikimate dehydrogenase (NADP(+)) n=1 Tax=Halobium salinum TaxID=1364940 RepID=A0ABD5PCZ0_9EURY|nr:shikimate dehydrogenase [Halobium salinum]